MREETEQRLSKQIAKLEFSKAFQAAAQLNGLSILKDLAESRTKDLEQMPGFNIQLVHEYVNYMEENGMGRLVDPPR